MCEYYFAIYSRFMVCVCQQQSYQRVAQSTLNNPTNSVHKFSLCLVCCKPNNLLHTSPSLRYLVTLPFNASHPFQQPTFPFPSHKRHKIIKFLYHPFQPFFHIFPNSHLVSFIWKCTKQMYIVFVLIFRQYFFFSLLQIIRGHTHSCQTNI